MGTSWTKAEEANLKELYGRNVTGKHAASILGRSADSVIKKAGRMGLSKPTEASPVPAAPAKELERERRTNAKLVERLQRMIQSHDLPVVEYMGKSAKFGAISDTHYGSLWERPDLVRKAYEIMDKEGIKDVFHAGDFCEGSGMRKGHEHQVICVGADNQVARVHDLHPQHTGMTTHFILGCHDLSFHKNAGHNIGERLAERKDLDFLGTETAVVPLKVGGTMLQLALEHPGKGTSYALSYQIQKYIEALPGGRKPDILLVGHYHKAFYMPMYRNVIAFQAGCFQSQTDWMRRMNLAAHLGFWMIEVHATHEGIARVKGEFTPFFEL